MLKKTASCWIAQAMQYEHEQDGRPYVLVCIFRKVIHTYSTSLVDIQINYN